MGPSGSENKPNLFYFKFVSNEVVKITKVEKRPSNSSDQSRTSLVLEKMFTANKKIYKKKLKLEDEEPHKAASRASRVVKDLGPIKGPYCSVLGVWGIKQLSRIIF